MLFTPFIRAGLLLAQLLLVTAASTAKLSIDPCVKIAGLQYVDPADAIACQKSFAFNGTLKQNLLSVISRVLDSFTFENYYLNSPSPFEESTTDIRAEIARINAKTYSTDYDLNIDLWDFITRLNDGHTRFFPKCYNTYQNILPAPVVILNDGQGDGIFIAPDTPDFFKGFGYNFSNYFEAKGFDWERLAGAHVHSIGGLPASDYIDQVARNDSGNYLDHGVRVSSVLSSYQLDNGRFSQRLGDLSSSNFIRQTSLTFSITTVNSTSVETVEVPFVASFVGNSFTDGKSYWENNCSPDNTTNGVDKRSSPSDASENKHRHARAACKDFSHPNTRISLPQNYSQSDLMAANGSTGVIKSFILPGEKTGVMFVGSFEGNFDKFQTDVDAAVRQFTAAGVTNLILDVTNNGGGYVCLGTFLHQYLAGTRAGSPAYNSTSRANSLAVKIVKANVNLNLNASSSSYASDNWQFINGTRIPTGYDYNDPSIPNIINGHNDSTSQYFADVCPTPNVTMPTAPPFDLKKIIIVGNGLCASTCAQFTTFMYEHYQTNMVVFGGNRSRPIEYKGMAGMQVLEWAEFDTQIKTAGLKNDPLAPPDLLLNADMRLNWRTAYSYINQSIPIAYLSQQPQYRFSYTSETYKNPQSLWFFVEQHFFGKDKKSY